MKKDFGKKNWMFPMPVLMIGTYGGDGTPDAMPAAWGGITLEDEITVCIDTAHQTWENIAARKAFTVAFATAETAAECDYLGLASGRDVPGKTVRCGLSETRSRFVDAPVFDPWPLVLECELVSMDAEKCCVVGRILNCAVEEAALTDGKPDAGKMKPVCFDPCAHVYRLVGEAVAPAFAAGRKYL
ncbi:MAG: flavin reductase [Kiritimatiellae bacterium]|nr:flavin reductase [Kiritimatiellia bacterium]